MSEDTFIKVLLTVIGLLIALAGYMYRENKKSAENSVDKLAERVNSHIEFCDEIPKELIMEKLESLCEKQDTHHEDATKQLDEVKASMRSETESRGALLVKVIQMEGQIQLLAATKQDKVLTLNAIPK